MNKNNAAIDYKRRNKMLVAAQLVMAAGSRVIKRKHGKDCIIIITTKYPDSICCPDQFAEKDEFCLKTCKKPSFARLFTHLSAQPFVMRQSRITKGVSVCGADAERGTRGKPFGFAPVETVDFVDSLIRTASAVRI